MKSDKLNRRVHRLIWYRDGLKANEIYAHDKFTAVGGLMKILVKDTLYSSNFNYCEHETFSKGFKPFKGKDDVDE